MASSNDQTQSSSAPKIVLSIDAMGGDNGPAVVVSGMAKSAAKNADISYIVHGDEALLQSLVLKHPVLNGRCDIRHAKKAVAMDEKPTEALRGGKNSSMWNTIEAVRTGDASVALSCGNTGALMAMSLIRLRPLPGVKRPAIAALWPSENPGGYNVILDVGADIRADADDLIKYALMGLSYARNGLGLKKPRIALLNVGTEEHKGRPELKEAHDMLSAIADQNAFRFVGFVEGNNIASDTVDVVVTDGFTGNVAIKTGEGTAGMIRNFLRAAFNHSIFSRIGALFALTSLSRLSKRIDPRRANGGVFLGLNGTVIKSHGGADATGVSAAIKLAADFVEIGFAEKLALRVASGTAKVQSDAKKSNH